MDKLMSVSFLGFAFWVSYCLYRAPGLGVAIAFPLYLYALSVISWTKTGVLEDTFLISFTAIVICILAYIVVIIAGPMNKMKEREEEEEKKREEKEAIPGRIKWLLEEERQLAQQAWILVNKQRGGAYTQSLSEIEAEFKRMRATVENDERSLRGYLSEAELAELEKHKESMNNALKEYEAERLK